MRILSRLLLTAALAGVLTLAASAPLLALEAPPDADVSRAAGQATEENRDVTPAVIWALVGVGLFSGTLGVLYLLKREMGGFDPRPGAWTAPISVMPSTELPVEESDFPAGDGDGHDH